MSNHSEADSPGPSSFGDELRRARRNQQLIQGRLGEAVGVSPTTVSNWERNRYQPSAAEVWGLEHRLGLSPGTLSRFLGYVPLDETTRLARELLALFSTGPVIDLLQRIVARHNNRADHGLSD